MRLPEFTQYLKTRDFSRPLNLVLNTGGIWKFASCLIPTNSLMVARDVAQMHQLEGARRNFFANVSHELRTPLTVLQGYLEMMDGQGSEGAVREKALHASARQPSGWKGW